MKTEYIVLQKNETLIQSIVRDAITFGFMAFCIYLSHGSKTWTAISGLMFLSFVMAKSAVLYSNQRKKFASKAELAEWANA